VYVLAVTVAPGPDAPHRDLDPEILDTVIRASARPDDRLAHVRSGTGLGLEGDAAGIVMFANADSFLQAIVTARRLCDRAIEACPELVGWLVRHVDSHTL
jgi:hypothetical protein